MFKFIPRSADDWFFRSSSNRNLSLQARSRHLRGSLLITMLLVAMVPLFITAGVSYFQYRVLLQNETMNNASQSAENARLTIEAFLDRLQAAILVASNAYSVEEFSDQAV